MGIRIPFTLAPSFLVVCLDHCINILLNFGVQCSRPHVIVVQAQSLIRVLL